MKKGKSKFKLRPADMCCCIHCKKRHWAPKCPKKRKSKTKQIKSGSSAHVAVKLSRSWEVGKILMAICNGHKIRQVNIAFIINTVDGILLDCVVTSHVFSKWHLFSLYYFLTNDKYITVGRHYYIPIVGIRSVTLTMILPSSISKLIFTNAFHIPILGADLISLNILHYKDALV